MPTRRRTKSSPARTRSPKAAAQPAVRVRMFRQGLGDCFLLTFDPGGAERHVLIDCGSLGAATTGIDMATVAKAIKSTTSNHLHLVVATHEHWDHVAGFGSQRNLFSGLKVDNVWMAWTENPADPAAKDLERYKRDLGVALAETRAALQAASGAGHERCAAAEKVIADVTAFSGDDAFGVGTKEGLSTKLDDAMQFVRTGLGVPAEYKNPGDFMEPEWLPGFRIYFLGPPRSRDKLSELGEHGSGELYGITSGLRIGALVRAAAGTGAAAVRADEVEGEMPFESRLRWSFDGDESAAAYPEYFAHDEAWRRVDGDWLHTAAEAGETLALQLDSLTNNTSLALAIERISDGKVLLFPADAQEGNWLSWHDPSMSWPVHGTIHPPITAGDLLKRTVFYKVGHHASHNGTAKGKGLEMMTGDGLTAFIPVDRKVALGRNPRNSWQMPARLLYRRLLDKCEGRVVRSDIGWAASADVAKLKDVEKDFAGMATKAEWAAWAKAQASAKHVEITPQWVDFLLE